MGHHFVAQINQLLVHMDVAEAALERMLFVARPATDIQRRSSVEKSEALFKIVATACRQCQSTGHSARIVFRSKQTRDADVTRSTTQGESSIGQCQTDRVPEAVIEATGRTVGRTSRQLHCDLIACVAKRHDSLETTVVEAQLEAVMEAAVAPSVEQQ